MYVVKFGKWSVFGTGRYYYSRMGWPFTKRVYLFGKIPFPICRRKKAETTIALIFDKYGLWDRTVVEYSIRNKMDNTGSRISFDCVLR